MTSRAVNGETVERFHSHDLENLRKELKHWQPYASVCPHCRTAPKESCRVCRGLPYVVKSAFERCPKALQDGVRAAGEN
jgi:hypothetical protein